MITLVRNFCLALSQLPISGGVSDNVLSSSFHCAINYPIRWPSVSDKVVAHSFALKPAAESEMKNLTTKIIRTQRID